LQVDVQQSSVASMSIAYIISFYAISSEPAYSFFENIDQTLEVSITSGSFTTITRITAVDNKVGVLAMVGSDSINTLTFYYYCNDDNDAREILTKRKS
jgi:hypothetical protein